MRVHRDVTQLVCDRVIRMCIGRVVERVEDIVPTDRCDVVLEVRRPEDQTANRVLLSDVDLYLLP
jgi:hypothetical protein